MKAKQEESTKASLCSILWLLSPLKGLSVVVGLPTNLFYGPKWKSLFKSDERKRMCPWQTANELSITDGKNQSGDTLSRFFLTKYRQKNDMTVSPFYNINREVCVFYFVPPARSVTSKGGVLISVWITLCGWFFDCFIKSGYYQMRWALDYEWCFPSALALQAVCKCVFNHQMVKTPLGKHQILHSHMWSSSRVNSRPSLIYKYSS